MKLRSLAVAAILMCSAVPAFADAWDSAMARAAAAKEKALDAGDPASWEETLRLFQEADAIRSTRESKYELAVAAAWLKQDDLACEAYEAAIALDLQGPARAKADAFLAEQAPRMARVNITGPASARVSIEGRPRGTLPHGAFVIFAGTAHVKIDHDGRSTTLEPHAKAGETPTFDVTEALAPPKAPPPPAPAKPPSRPSVEPAPRSALGPVLLISGGVVMVAGAVTWIYAAGREAHYDDVVRGYCDGGTYDASGFCTQLPAGRTEADKAAAEDASKSYGLFKGIRIAGMIGLAGGAIAAATGAVLTFGSRPEKTVTLRPSATALAGGAFLGIDGSF